MKLMNRNVLDVFKEKHPQSRKPLADWETVANETDYLNFTDLRKTFSSADYTSSGYTIFNIGGHKYRLITEVDYKYQIIEIKVLWTHAEYSSTKNTANLARSRL